MGQSQGSQALKQFSNNSLKKFQETYVFVNEKNDERWGVIQIWKEKTSKRQVMILTKNFHNDPDFKEYLNILKTRLSLENGNLVEFIGWSNEDGDGICGHNRKFNLYVEYFSQNLEKEINRRTAGKEFFEEAEIWYLGRTAVSFGESLQANGISHGDIRPVQILLTEGQNEEGQIRFTDNGVIGQFKNAYNLTLSAAGRGFLSPKLIRAYAKKEVNPQYDVYKADVYSLGMTLLQAATLRDPHKNYYDWITKEVNSNAIEKGLKDVETRYSLQLAKYIASMLDEDETTRPDFINIGRAGLAPVISKPFVNLPPQLQGSIVKPAFPLQQQPVFYPQPPLNYGQIPLQQGQIPLQQGQIPLQQSYVQPAFVQPLQTSSFLPQSRPFQSQGPYGGGISYVSQSSPQKRFENVEDLSDLDRRVQEAIRTTEETINRNSQIPNLVETQAVHEEGNQE